MKTLEDEGSGVGVNGEEGAEAGVYCAREQRFVEVEACGCASTCCRHSEDKIRSGAKAWAKKTKAAGG